MTCTPTFSTSSGTFGIGGIPYTAAGGPAVGSSILEGTYNPGGGTLLGVVFVLTNTSNSIAVFTQGYSGGSNWGTANFTSAASVTLQGSITYFT